MKRTTFTQLLLIALVFTTSAAHADATTTPHLFQEIQARVRTLTHSIDTYSWTTGAKMGGTASSPLSPTDPRAKAFVQSHINAFQTSLELSAHESMGVGLYLAADPVATLYYGGQQDWALLQLPFQVGSNYLDFRYENNVGTSLDLSDAAQKEIQSSTCTAKTFPDLTSGTCRAVFVSICNSLNVDLIAYSYTIIQFPNIPNRADTSFVLASGKNVNWNRFRVFTSALPSGLDPDLADQSVIETAFIKMIPPSWLTDGQQDIPKFLASLLPWSQIPLMTDGAWISYISQHYFEAGSYPEDQLQTSATTSPATTP